MAHTVLYLILSLFAAFMWAQLYINYAKNTCVQKKILVLATGLEDTMSSSFFPN